MKIDASAFPPVRPLALHVPQVSDPLRRLSDDVLCPAPSIGVVVPTRAVGWIVAEYVEVGTSCFMHASSGVVSLEKREPCDGVREQFFDFLVVPSSSCGVRAVAHTLCHQVQCKRHVIVLIGHLDPTSTRASDALGERHE